MRHCYPHKGYRTRKCRYAGSQHTGQQYKKDSESLHIQSHIGRISLTHLIGTDRLRQQKHTDRGNSRHQHYGFDILPCHTGKTALGPVMQIHNIRIFRKGDDKIRHCRTDIADHHTADDQHSHLLNHT